jgi:RNA-splicing ligase RtcB
MDIIAEIKESWGWVGIEPEEVVGENDFGNLMIKDVHGKYWRMCPEDVYCEVVANNREELDSLSRDQEFLEDWYMQAIVEAAKDKYGPLEEGRNIVLSHRGRSEVNTELPISILLLL